MVHLAVPSGPFAVRIKSERGGLGEYRSDSFRSLDTTDVSTDAIALSKPECEVRAFLLSFRIESVRALPALLIPVRKWRDHVYRIAGTHALPTKLDILLDDATHGSEGRQESQTLFDEACHEGGLTAQLGLQLLVAT
jgi:hypothetical protein